MDPRFGLDMEALRGCLEKCQEEDIVQNFNLQVTGGVNFGFTALKGTPNQRNCKPTVQKRLHTGLLSPIGHHGVELSTRFQSCARPAGITDAKGCARKNT